MKLFLSLRLFCEMFIDPKHFSYQRACRSLPKVSSISRKALMEHANWFNDDLKFLPARFCKLIKLTDKQSTCLCQIYDVHVVNF